MYEEMAAFVDDHSLTPIVDSIFPLNSIHEALRHLDQGNLFGKIVIAVE